jgi:3-deoxy-7-phosphoheptulonate synthase
MRETAELLRKAGLPPRIMVDCSHANSEKDHTKQAVVWRDVLRQRAAGNDAIFGLMLESNLCAGKQALTADPKDLRYGVSITDGCVDWDETEALIREAHSGGKSRITSDKSQANPNL